MNTEQEWRSEVLHRLATLTEQKVNDVVRLAFMDETNLRTIKSMDLGCLTELKRKSDGTVEMKFIDRVDALEKLFDMAGKSGNGAEKFFKALEQTAQNSEEE